MRETKNVDPVVVLGAGLAGLTTALQLSDTRHVIVLAKGARQHSATAWAQGGIVGVIGTGDSVDGHVRDTQVAGAGLVDERVARMVSSASGEAIRWLIEQGVPFSRDPDGPMGLHLTREGGHGMPRILHAADASGRAIHETLLTRALAHPGITLRDGAMAVDLIVGTEARGKPTCHGVEVLDLASGRLEALAASAVVLATGGLGQLYPHTSNPTVATGDGIAMAWRAGCRVANMEFIQFHPTCLHHPRAGNFLITEALRGEGALLVLPDGTRFMPAHDARAELAPRDIVARAIASEMKRHGVEHVGLDATGLGQDFLLQHFPTVHARCLALGIDIAREPIPVVPAAHYACGGVVTDLKGRTGVDGLYAVGEVACTGLHGANRLASNSLLECVVLGQSCAAFIKATPAVGMAAISLDSHIVPMAPQTPGPSVVDVSVVDVSVVADARAALQRLMADGVGIVRTTAELLLAYDRIETLQAEVDAATRGHRVTPDVLELRNLLVCAALVVRSGLSRHESRGAHFSRDYPTTLPDGLPTVLSNVDQTAIRSSTRIE